MVTRIGRAYSRIGAALAVDRLDVLTLCGIGLVTYAISELYSPAGAALVLGVGLLLLVGVNLVKLAVTGPRK